MGQTRADFRILDASCGHPSAQLPEEGLCTRTVTGGETWKGKAHTAPAQAVPGSSQHCQPLTWKKKPPQIQFLPSKPLSFPL